MQENHTGYLPDSVDIVGAGSDIDGILQKRLQRAGFRVQLLSPDQLAEIRPRALVINATCCAGGQAMPAALEVCRHLARLDRNRILHISSYQVFSGSARKRYDEDDEPQPTTEAGYQWLACEEALAGHEQVTILRFGWMVDRSEDALLGRILRGLVARQTVVLDDRERGSPVTLFDLARVTVAVVQQLASGAPTAGVYHYGAADSCTALEYAGEVVERAQSFYEEEFAVELQALPGTQAESSVVLACGKVRDVFGIQQRSWRQGLTRQVELWLERLESERQDGAST